MCSHPKPSLPTPTEVTKVLRFDDAKKRCVIETQTDGEQLPPIRGRSPISGSSMPGARDSTQSDAKKGWHMPHAQTRWVHPVRPGEVGGLTQGVGGYPDGRRWDAHMLQSAGIAPAPRQGRQSSERECEPMTVGIYKRSIQLSPRGGGPCERTRTGLVAARWIGSEMFACCT